MLRFEKYFEPHTVGECVQLLKEFGSDAKIIAGGTDVIPRLKSKAIQPKAIVSIHRIPGLGGIKVEGASLVLGAMARLRDISLSPELSGQYAVIKQAAGHVSSMQVRNVATIGGNACNASPSADAVEGLIVLDAVAVIEGCAGKREVPVAEFFTGPGTTVLKKDEMLTAFKVPAPKPKTGAVYKKYAIRGDTDISIVGVGAALALGSDGKVSGARISLAAVAPTPFRAKKVEELITGKTLTNELICEAADIAAANISPINDQRASAGYRIDMVRVWTKHALAEALALAK